LSPLLFRSLTPKPPPFSLHERNACRLWRVNRALQGLPPSDETAKFLAGFQVEPSIVSKLDGERDESNAMMIRRANLNHLPLIWRLAINPVVFSFGD
jgi:hypothetical protein